MHLEMRTAVSDFDNPNIKVVTAMPRIPARTTGRRPMTSKKKVSAKRGSERCEPTGETGPMIYGCQLGKGKGTFLEKGEGEVSDG